MGRRRRPPSSDAAARLAEHSNRNNGTASPKNRDQRNSPDGVAEQSRSDPHTHSHDEHDCGWNNGNKLVHGALELGRAHDHSGAPCGLGAPIKIGGDAGPEALTHVL